MSTPLPYVSITANSISYYKRFPRSTVRSQKQLDNLVNLENNQTRGLISHKASKKVKTAINWLLYHAKEKRYYSKADKQSFKFKINFVTLTLASKQMHTDQEIKKECLNQFLIELRRDFGVWHYLWRAEAQENGNIHFHIVTDKFIPWSQLRKSWNRIQNKLGYVDRYADEQREFHKDGFRPRKELASKWGINKQKKAYLQGMRENWQNPNSTDVHAVKKIKNISAYLAKYCAKNGEKALKPTGVSRGYSNSDPSSSEKFTIECVAWGTKVRAIEGRLWGLSQSLSKLKSAVELMFSQAADEFEILYSKFSDRVYEYDYATIIYVKIEEWRKEVNGALSRILSRYLQEWKTITTFEPPTLFKPY